uniref:Solute carrier family 39 member 1 n=1 Tax=Salarias fasciatus TaxID=181472 RepID=A0A672FZR2_SALFA
MFAPLLRRPPDGPAGLSLEHIPVLETKVGTLVVLLVVTLLSGFTPLCVLRRTCGLQPDVRRLLLSLLGCFAGGVFLAACLLDLLPDYLQGFTQTFSEAGVTLRFPLPEFIVALGFFLVLVLEQLTLAFKEQSSSLQEECQGLLVDPADPDGPVQVDSGARSALRAFVLVFSLSLHSALEGLAAGLLEAGLLEGGRDVPGVCLALMVHQSVVSFSLSIQLSRGRLRRSVVAGCLLLFAAASPTGAALGLGLLACGTLEGLAVGTFSYITSWRSSRTSWPPHAAASPRWRRCSVASYCGHRRALHQIVAMATPEVTPSLIS